MMRISVLTVSDRCAGGAAEDRSGPAISEMLRPFGETACYRIVPDEKEQIEKALIEMCDGVKSDLVLTTGGTGLAPRDVTPEATKAVIEKEAPGIPEAIRAASMQITPRAMLSRATAGVRGSTLIINLPGSPKAVKESLSVVLPVLEHTMETLSGRTISCGSEGKKP